MNSNAHNTHAPACVSAVTSFYELSAVAVTGKMEQFSRYDGHVTLVVNVASCDRNSAREFQQLNDLMATYSNKGLAVFAFPCHQFGGCEPLDNHEILPFLHHVRPGHRFDPKFALFSKCDVNGCRSSPVYEYLKLKLPFPSDEDAVISRESHAVLWSPVTRYDLGGNFEKFLVTHDGQPVKRYTARTNLESLKRDIEHYIKKMPRAVRESHGFTQLPHSVQT